MSIVMVDVETDGPIPGDYSMVALGAVVVDAELDKTFYGVLAPISDKWIPEVLAVSGVTRKESLYGNDPKVEMECFRDWLKSLGSRPMFYSDNNGFDWQFVNWYFHHFLGENPFGHSSTNLGSLYKGLVKSTRENFKHLRKTKHNHDPVNDAKSNAEALLYMRDKMGMRL